MSLRDQSDKDLADAGRMLIDEINKISAELERRGVSVNLQGYYGARHGDGHYYAFEAKRITEEVI
jgi:hypothetical protein